METEPPVRSIDNGMAKGDYNLSRTKKWYWGRCNGCGEITGVYDRISCFGTPIRLCTDCINEIDRRRRPVQ